VQGLPWLLVGAGLGVIVDRTDRRRLMLVVDITRAVIIAALAAAVLAHGAGLMLIYLTASTTGAGSALRDTAAVTCVPRLVEQADLDRANGAGDRRADRRQRVGRSRRGRMAIRAGCRPAVRGQRRNAGRCGAVAAHTPERVPAGAHGASTP